MRNVRLKWEKKQQRPRWISPDIFEQLIAHWNSETFKEISEKANKNRVSEVGGCNYAGSSISVVEVARRMREELGRNQLLNELHLETHLKRNGESIDDLSRNTQEEFDRQLAIKLSNHPELAESQSGYPVDPSLAFSTSYDTAGGKKKNGRVYGVGGYGKTMKRRDRCFRMRLADGEGTLAQPILTAEMFETVRNLAKFEAAQQVAARNAEIEEMQQEMQRREIELQEEMRRQTQEYQEAMRIANERVLRFDQFFASQNSGGGFGGTNDNEGVFL